MNTFNFAAAATCGSNLPASCQNTTAIANTCCTVTAGSLVQTQFWDYDPSTGPSDSWTIHGLWPDYCDGGYPETCDDSRQYTDIAGILTDFGEDDTLSYMQTYWKDYEGDDESFWEHEWGKHGTCVSTLDTDCYTNYQDKEEAADFFKVTVDLFKTLPTYEWLSAAGITPSDSKTYTRNDILDALQSKHDDKLVYIDCEDDNLNQVWYYFNAQGPLQNGDFVPADMDGSGGSCPSSGIKYTPKSGSSNATSAKLRY